MTPPFHSGNTNFAYQIRFHLGFTTYRRQPVFCHSEALAAIQNICQETCAQSNYHQLEVQAEATSVRTFISLAPPDVPARVVQTLKANLSRRWNREHIPPLRWSRGTFFRSVGTVTAETVSQYVASQRDHHADTVKLLCEFVDPDCESLLGERSYAHCYGQYAAHLVVCPVRHVPAIDSAMAETMMRLFRLIADRRGFSLAQAAVLQDHVHLLVAPPPTMSLEFAALALMNNTSYWFGRNNPGLFNVWDVPGLWSPSAYIGTIGDVTSGHVRNYLRCFRA